MFHYKININCPFKNAPVCTSNDNTMNEPRACKAALEKDTQSLLNNTVFIFHFQFVENGGNIFLLPFKKKYVSFKV